MRAHAARRRARWRVWAGGACGRATAVVCRAVCHHHFALPVGLTIDHRPRVRVSIGVRKPLDRIRDVCFLVIGPPTRASVQCFGSRFVTQHLRVLRLLSTRERLVRRQFLRLSLRHFLDPRLVVFDIASGVGCWRICCGGELVLLTLTTVVVLVDGNQNLFGCKI